MFVALSTLKDACHGAPQKQRKGGCPRLSNWHLSFLHGIFQAADSTLSTWGKRNQVTTLAFTIFQEMGCPVSRSLVSAELRHWLRAHGHPVKPYVR
jgi:hypothetical protein